MMSQIQNSISLQVQGNMNVNDITDRSRDAINKIKEASSESLSNVFNQEINNKIKVLCVNHMNKLIGITESKISDLLLILKI